MLHHDDKICGVDFTHQADIGRQASTSSAR
jgi:hypothetical protein